MRKVLILCITLFIILAVAPLLASYISEDNKSEGNTESTSISSDNEIDEEYILKYAAYIADEDFCDEGLKAVLSITKNNTLYFETEGKEKDNISAEMYSEEFLQRLRKIYNEVEINIKYKNETVYIPTSSLSAGFTKEDENYPYLRSVASPWDTFNDEFIYGKDYSTGVSLEGINYLCSNEADYKTALKWYLPEFEIK